MRSEPAVAPPVDAIVPAYLRMSEHVRAIRHGALEASARMLSPGMVTGLLADLLRQPDEAEPLAWLRTERTHTCAVLALGLALDLATRLQRRPRSPRDGAATERGAQTASLDRDLARLFGQLVAADTGARALSWDPSAMSEAALPLARQALGRLREASDLVAGQQPDLSLVEPGLLTLLADLLRLPGEIDATAWLSTERADLCAVVVLRFLLDCVIPGSELTERDPVPRKVGSYARCRVADGELDVVVTGLSVHRIGFTAHVEARFPEPADRIANVAWSTWEGFERVSDSDGRLYIARPLEQTLSKEVWPWSRGWRETLALLCTPSLPSSRTVTFESPSAAISSYRRVTLAGQLVPLPTRNLGQIACSVKI